VREKHLPLLDNQAGGAACISMAGWGATASNRHHLMKRG